MHVFHVYAGGLPLVIVMLGEVAGETLIIVHTLQVNPPNVCKAVAHIGLIIKQC